MFHRRWFAFLIVFSMTVAVLIPRVSYSQTRLSDIQGHWAQPCIEQIVQKQIIQEYEDGTFRPSLPVTRDEFAYAIAKAFPEAAKVRKPIKFADIPSNYWAGDAIYKAYETGFLSAYIGEIFNPLRKITREQVLLALVNGLKYSPSQPADRTLKAVFDDAQDIPQNSKNAIAAATEKLLVVNYPNARNLKPNQLATRAEVAAFLCQAMGSSQLVPTEYIAKIGEPTPRIATLRTPTTPTAADKSPTTPTQAETTPPTPAAVVRPSTTQTSQAVRTSTTPTEAETTPPKPRVVISESTTQTSQALRTPTRQRSVERTPTTPTEAETTPPKPTAVISESTTQTSQAVRTPTRQRSVERIPTTEAEITPPKPRVVINTPTIETPITLTEAENTPPTATAVINTRTTSKSELRGVWLTNIDSDVLFDRDRLTSAIERLAKLNFNTVYPTVWNWGYTLYPSKTAERVIGRKLRLVTPIDEHLDPDLGTERDVLQEIVTQAHKKGMGVIPWFEFGFMAPADGELVKLHPDWILQRRDGSQLWIEGPHERVWINPFRPEVQQFIQNLVLEIVTNYDVDGIQFDDHFGFPSEFGYDDYTVELYRKEHNGQYPPDDPKDPEWIRWRADKITAYMQRLHKAIKQRKPKAIVSVSPNPQPFSYSFFLADWDTWEQRGLIDELILQVYRNDINTFIGELERPEVKVVRDRIPVSIGIMTGVKPQPIPMTQIQEQVQVVRDRGFAGVSFFFYESLWNLTKEPPIQRQSGLLRLFPTRMQRPNM